MIWEMIYQISTDGQKNDELMVKICNKYIHFIKNNCKKLQLFFIKCMYN